MTDHGRPRFWRDKADRLVGRHVLVGLTVLDGEDQLVEQRRYHGLIESADESRGLAVRRADTGLLEWLPPDLRPFQPAPRGEYRLRSSGEVVSDPDLLASWTVRRDRT